MAKTARQLQAEIDQALERSTGTMSDGHGGVVGDSAIRQLQGEARDHDDDLQFLVCARALDSGFDAEDYTGGGHRLSAKQWRMLRGLSQRDARLMCAAVVRAGLG